MKNAFLLLVISGLLSSACSMKTRRTEDLPPAPAQTGEETAPNAVTPTAEAPPPAEEPKIEIRPATPPPAAHASHHVEKKGVEAEKALGWLKNGNIRYRKGSLRKDGQSQKDVKRLSTGQAPHAIILSCSDSRVPPEVIFDQKLGEVFVIRNAGEIPDRSSIASIEYAVEHLGSRLVVVMGHTSCGAVKAALGTMDGADAGSPSLNALVHDIHPRLASFKETKPSANVEEESWANARGVAHDLIGRSEIIRSRVANGDLVVKAALYRLEDGKVIFDAAQKEK
ncbi:MAG: carbonic anhydrase [Pseudobdellovibrionaceae bacterium]